MALTNLIAVLLRGVRACRGLDLESSTHFVNVCGTVDIAWRHFFGHQVPRHGEGRPE